MNHENKPDLEQDLKTTDWLVARVCSSDSYAQNLYAALCNNEFQKQAVWPVLKNETWHCSWRYAGGIIADIRCEGSYLDWYCSGSYRSSPDDDLAMGASDTIGYVDESVVTHEIEQDLLTLGWMVVTNHEG